MASDDKLKRTIKIESMEMRQSPPKAIVDCSPLQPAISKNKEGNFLVVWFVLRLHSFHLSDESIKLNEFCIRIVLALKIKLMVRRPIAQLVDQGIIPCKYETKSAYGRKKF